jgi:GT2 family glycosyltransferase
MEDLLIVIVLFKQRLRDSLAFNSLQDAQQGLSHPTYWVWDNSPQIDDSVITEAGLLYEHHPENTGVSQAYNQAFAFAARHNKKWIFLADQDTEFPRHTLLTFQEATQNNKEMHLFALLMTDGKGIVSPFKWIKGRGIRKRLPVDAVLPLDEWNVINSGLIISTKAFAQCGGYDEMFPIDLSDIVFVEQARKHFKEFMVLNIVCLHSLSDNETSYTYSFQRFNYFCHAMLAYKQKFNPQLNISFIILRRALKLSIKFRNVQFLRTGYDSAFRSN